MTARPGALRRRRKQSLATRLRVGWIFIVTIVVAVGYAGYIIVTLPALRVHAVSVRIAGLTVTERQVLKAATVDRSSNMWLIDTAKIERRIEAIPYVDAVRVGRVLPAQLTIAVTEREPAACVQSGSQIVTVDATGRILQAGCGRESALRIELRNVALAAAGTDIRAPELATLLADGRALRKANVAVRSIREDGFGQLVAVDSDGIELLFGSDVDLAEKAKLVAPVLAAARPGRMIHAVDLRAPATPTVQFQ